MTRSAFPVERRLGCQPSRGCSGLPWSGSCLDPCCCEVRPPLVGSWVKWTEIKLFLLAPLTTRERRTEVDEFEGM